MGRRLSEHSSVTRQYFIVDVSSRYVLGLEQSGRQLCDPNRILLFLCSVCKICHRVVPGQHNGNLRRHLQRHHSEVVDEAVFPDRSVGVEKRPSESRASGTTHVAAVKRFKQEPVFKEDQQQPDEEQATESIFITAEVTSPKPEESYDKQIDILAPSDYSVYISPIEIRKLFLEMITKDAFPVDFMESTAFRKLMDVGEDDTINARSICADIRKAAQTIRESIRAQLKESDVEMRSICVDGKLMANNRMLVGVWMQMLEQTALTTRMIGVFEQPSGNSPLGAWLPKEVARQCGQYGVDMKQIYGCLLTLPGDDQWPIGLEVMPVPCLADAFQRAVIKSVFEFDFLRKTKTKGNPGADSVLNVSQTIDEIILVLQALTERHGAGESNNTLKLDKSAWPKVDELIEKCLKPATKTYSMLMNKRKHMITDRYAIIYKFLLQLERNETPVCQSFHENVKKQFHQQLAPNNLALMAALFLDPRYQALLTESEIRTAKGHLIDLHKRLSKQKGGNNPTTTTTATSNPVPVHGDDDDDEDEDDDEDILMEFLRNKTKVQPASPKLSIERLLDEFEGTAMPSVKSNPFQYWNGAGTGDKLPLKRLAMLVLAQTGAQVHGIDSLNPKMGRALATNRHMDRKFLDDLLLVIANGEDIRGEQ